MGRGGRFLDHRGILLCDMVHLADRGVDLDQAQRLLPRRKCYCIDVDGDVRDMRFDAEERIARLPDEIDAACHFPVGAADQFGNFACGAGGALRKFANLLRNNRKALAGLAGARCLNAGVQRQKVGLKCDLVDDAGDL